MLSFKDYGTSDKDLGEKQLLAEAAAFNRAEVASGLFDGETHPESELSIAQIGTVHEFGSPKQNIPERSWLRRAIRERDAQWQSMLTGGIDRVVQSKGQVSVLSVLVGFAEKVASDIRRTIDSVTSPPKAESTIRREGGALQRTKSGKVKKGAYEHQKRFDHPLIWLGYMRAAVRSRVILAGKSPKMTPKGKR